MWTAWFLDPASFSDATYKWIDGLQRELWSWQRSAFAAATLDQTRSTTFLCCSNSLHSPADCGALASDVAQPASSSKAMMTRQRMPER